MHIYSSCTSTLAASEEVGGAVGGLLLLGGIVAGVFVYRKRRQTVGGLNTKFMTTARQNRGAL